MDDTALLKRISMNPDAMVGKAVINGTRLTVEYIVGITAHGASTNEILGEYPELAEDDINSCLLFARSGLISVSSRRQAVIPECFSRESG